MPPRLGSGFHQRVKTQCVHGHPFSPENTYLDKNGHRSCRQCRGLKPLKPSEQPKKVSVRDAESEKWKQLLDAAKQVGLPAKRAMRLIQRLSKRDGLLDDTLKQVTPAEFLALIDDRAFRVLLSMDDVAIAEADLGELGSALKVLLDKRALLRGEPTQIMGWEQRKNLSELLPLVMQELKMRGKLIDLKPSEYQELDGA